MFWANTLRSHKGILFPVMAAAAFTQGNIQKQLRAAADTVGRVLSTPVTPLPEKGDAYGQAVGRRQHNARDDILK